MSALYVPASAANITVNIQGQQVHTSISLSLVQNITALPNITTTVDSATQSNLSAAFDQGLSHVNPNAASSGLTVGITSTKGSLNLTCSMNVAGVSQRNGDIVSVNMTWLAFNVTSDLRAANLSYNTIGSRYFRPVVAYYANQSRFVGRPNATFSGVTFFVNGTSFNPTQAQEYAGNFTMIDFSALNATLDQWNRTYTLTNNTTTWRYSPPQLFNFDMRIQRKNVTADYVATYGYSAKISVSGLSRSQGHTILIDVGTGEMGWVMAAIVILAVFSAISVQVMYRNRRKRVGKFQRR
jgi:hypothetical protein